MNGRRGFIRLLTGLTLFFCLGCYKPMNLETESVPANSLILEFVAPIKYVIHLQVDGVDVPIKFGKRNRTLLVDGLAPGDHTFTIHSISYIFGPEYQTFHLKDDKGAYFFIQSRKYRSALPKNKAQASIRAYRKKLKKEGIDVSESSDSKIRARFIR